jgi:hypothetical protein
MRRSWFLAGGLLILAAGPSAPVLAQDPSEADLEFFEAKIRPLIVESCQECHSGQLARPKGGLVMDTRADLLRGGAAGEVLVPGDPDASLLIEAVRYEGDPRMPPDGKLEAAQIALLEEWVRRGAPMPEAEGLAPGTSAPKPPPDPLSHWAFRPLDRPGLPQVRDSAWCANEIDRFVLARLEGMGFPTPERADRRTLLRRLTFDLTGLPPTPEEVEQFLADASPDAWERVVDRLLASPHYGERWGRAWLDLARYSDSNGLDENLAMSAAFRYRDWVVRALNEDLPYDRFLTLQLAGDLLPEPEDATALADQLVATGFLVLGPKMLAEQDKEKLVLDVVDEQMDVAFRTFQGLTLGCARCHDHKFDPLSQREYTALAGVFKSTETLGSLAFVSRWKERELASKARLEARREAEAVLAEAEGALTAARHGGDAALVQRWIGSADAYLLAATEAARGAVLLEAEDSSRGNLIRDDATYGTPTTVIARTGAGGLQFAEYDLTFPVAGRRMLEVRLAAEESRPMRVLLNGALVFESALGATTGFWKAEGQRWRAVGALDLPAGRSVLRLEREGPVPHLDQLLLAPLGSDASSRPTLGHPWAQGLEPGLLRNWTLRLAGDGQGAASGPESGVGPGGKSGIFGPWLALADAPEAEFEERAEHLGRALREAAAATATPAAAPGAEAVAAAPNPLVLALFDGLAPRSQRELAGRYQVLFSSVEAQWRELSARDPKAERLPSDAAEGLRLLLTGPAGLFHLEPAELEALYPEQDRSRLAAARAAVEAARSALPPAVERALGVGDAPEIAGLPVMRRGSHLDKGPQVVERGVPALASSFLASPAMPAGESGRRELARWMTDPEHPLTARVAVNRLWQGHFGAGLVRTSSNFGLRGDTPSHPELLDWLAREFVARGWSQKALHRLICLSSTYQSSAEPSARAAALDPGNRLLSHQNRRRLAAEELRDALLFTAGRLDPALGGSLLEIGNGEYVTNDQSKDAARYDSPRRSLYLPIIRNAMLDLFSTFDYPDPSTTVEARPSTTSPTQALYLMNSPLVVDAAARLAEAALERSPDPQPRVNELYRRAFGRAPTAEESARLLGFAQRAAASVLRARAKRVIFLFMHGGPSQVDTFDYKPLLERDHGKPLPFEKPRIQFAETGNLLKSPWKFAPARRIGRLGQRAVPHVARHVDDLCFVKSLHGTNEAHGGALLKLCTPAPTPSCARAWARGSSTGSAPRTATCPASSRSARRSATAACNNWSRLPARRSTRARRSATRACPPREARRSRT